MEVEFQNAIEVPVAWREPLARTIRSVFGKKGYDRYVVAAMLMRIVEDDPQELRDSASKLKLLADTKPDEFNGLLGVAVAKDRLTPAAKAAAGRLRDSIDNAQNPKARRRSKSAG